MHQFMVNTTGKVMEHPVSGQPIQPGQRYTVPDEAELKAQDKGVKAWDKARAKEEADAKAKADADAKAAEEAAKKAQDEADAEAKEVADAQAQAQAEADAKAQADAEANAANQQEPDKNADSK